ncbi:MAG TPA: hypothetical protein VGN69_09050 [Solirubrobacteraceae bacterium]|jgi:hypothetical protein|nr:hypothetical protein [Solirubrobacteraceae bacterium]
MSSADDELVREQAQAAAREAAAIGGDPGHHEPDPALAPVAEAGGGVAEGFEQAEEDLIDNAENFDVPGSPRNRAYPAEREADRAGAVYADADELTSTERVDDAEGRTP